MQLFLTELDILDAIYDIRCTLLDYIMHFFTLLGEAGVFWITLVIVLMIIPKTRRIGFCAAAALAAEALMVNVIIKPLVKRVRPCYANTKRVIDTIVKVPNDYSFPSGHAGASFAVSTVITRHNLKLGLLSLLTSALISFSRLYFYVHYPTDVLAGTMIGVFTGIIMDKLIAHLLKRHDENKQAAPAEEPAKSSEDTKEQEPATELAAQDE